MKVAQSPQVSVNGLDPEPATAGALFTVTAASGESETFTLSAIADDCPEDGGLVLEVAGQPAQAVDLPGTAPYTYSLDLALGSTPHTATATWPDDLEFPGSGEVLVTEWDPPLPVGD